jgi:hypothetical protein
MQAHISQHAAAAEVTGAADEQQHQGHHQLAPATPPPLLMTSLLQALKLTLGIAQMTGEAQSSEARQQGLSRRWRFEFHPS